MKTCTQCGVAQDLDQFYKHKLTKDGLRSSCKACDNAESRKWHQDNRERRRATTRKRKYGITQDQFDSQLEAQRGKCAICGTSTPGGSGWHVDHCHESKKVRGILCTSCNTGIGNLRDDPILCSKASAYLRHPPYIHNQDDDDPAESLHSTDPAEESLGTPGCNQGPDQG